MAQLGKVMGDETKQAVDEVVKSSRLRKEDELQRLQAKLKLEQQQELLRLRQVLYWVVLYNNTVLAVLYIIGTEWSGMEWSGVEWSGVEWNGVVAQKFPPCQLSPSLPQLVFRRWRGTGKLLWRHSSKANGRKRQR